MPDRRPPHDADLEAVRRELADSHAVVRGPVRAAMSVPARS
ncbi:hypothetical protein [Methylorubrum podarium]|nr:hypothetical protein [Methylorubrum podarium]